MNIKLMWRQFYQSEAARIVFIAIMTALTGELKVMPFDGEMFRFALGGIVFFLLILIYPPVSVLRTGFVTAVTVVVFRVMKELWFGAALSDSLLLHMPVFLFYFIVAIGWHVVGLEKYKSFPLRLGALAFLFEVVSNTSEHALRNWWLHSSLLNSQEWGVLVGVALLRSFFTVGLYSSVALSKEKQRVEEMLGVGSELYVEALYLQKSMNHIEQITASSHDLYRKLKKENQRELSTQALHIAQEIHEVKKDSQRILAGLSKWTTRQQIEVFYLSDLLDMVVTANEKYSEMIGKECVLETTINEDFQTGQHVPLLAVLNNLTANAVEAIERKGRIFITIDSDKEWVHFSVHDTGKGIPIEHEDVIFEPGYTTKFTDQGTAATGIGLSHVSAIIDAMQGTIDVERLDKGLNVTVKIPMESIMKEIEA
ncbi:two component sensor histidine kinase [Sporosarcina ureae]|uniref:sensor histidine kinase n=1 Tax=Sporosarcina ureae TaxID=1571 RepID=UPI000A1643DE|nr:sensor histidine kinase [Sporosarcina ureae]ARJ39186.1 two component sensor histidine kinase [Sporosarcina ureae]